MFLAVQHLLFYFLPFVVFCRLHVSLHYNVFKQDVLCFMVLLSIISDNVLDVCAIILAALLSNALRLLWNIFRALVIGSDNVPV